MLSIKAWQLSEKNFVRVCLFFEWDNNSFRVMSFTMEEGLNLNCTCVLCPKYLASGLIKKLRNCQDENNVTASADFLIRCLNCCITSSSLIISFIFNRFTKPLPSRTIQAHSVVG